MVVRIVRAIMAIAISSLFGVGCAELQTESPSVNSSDLKVHAAGWKNPGSEAFHGVAIEQANWSMQNCKSCHGGRFDGGKVEVSCLTCHTKPGGPEHCSTCHGGLGASPPRSIAGESSPAIRGVGAHAIHLSGSSISDAISCGECHSVPGSVSDAGHLDMTRPADVLLASTLANTTTNESHTVDYDLQLPLVEPNSAYDAEHLTCGSTYCHGDFKNGNAFSPVWNDPSGVQMACGTCHGDTSRPAGAGRALPRTSEAGGTHPNSTSCSACHSGVIDANGVIVNKSKHINGKLNVFGQERDF